MMAELTTLINSTSTESQNMVTGMDSDGDERGRGEPGPEKLKGGGEPVNRRETLRPFVKLLTGFAAISGFLFGYDTGVVSGAMILLREQFNLSILWQELIVSATIGAAAILSLAGGVLNGLLGRRLVIIIASIVFTAGAVLMGIAPNKETLLVGRLVVGMGIGLSSMTVPMYIAEVAPTHMRGRLVTLNNMFITGGQFAASVVDGIFSYWPWGWRAMLGLAGLPSLIQLIGFLFLPESPRWLIDHGHLDKAKKVLSKTCGPENYITQFEEIYEDTQATQRIQREQARYGPVIIRIFKTPPVLRALIVGCGLQMFQQLAGINTIMYYSASIIRMAGVEDDSTVIWLSSAVASVNFIFTIVGVYLVEKIGRRLLTLGSFLGVAVSVLFLSISFLVIARSSPFVDIPNTSICGRYGNCDACSLDESCGFCYQTQSGLIYNTSCLVADPLRGNQSTTGLCTSEYLLNHESKWAHGYCPSPYSYLALIGLIVYLMFFAPGMGPMPWTINSEIYPQWARSTGNAVATTVNWVFNLLIAMTFLSLTQAITRQGTFFLYFCICVIGILFLYFLLPETKGTKLEDVSELFNRPVCCGSSTNTSYRRFDASESRTESVQPLLD